MPPSLGRKRPRNSAQTRREAIETPPAIGMQALCAVHHFVLIVNQPSCSLGLANKSSIARRSATVVKRASLAAVIVLADVLRLAADRSDR